MRDVKILGYHRLRDAFAPLAPRLWCNIASVAAVHPLRGEIDYGPANAYLFAAADHPSATREITLGFPLWRESGYFAARPSLISQIISQGRLTGISDAEGVAHFLAELAPTRSGPASSVYIGARERTLLRRELPGLLAEPPLRETPSGAEAPRSPSTLSSAPATPGPGAFLTAPPHRRNDGSTAWELAFDSADHGYLAHHLVNGEPTVPGTFLLAAAAEAALALHSGTVPTALLDASFDTFVRPSTDHTRRRYTLTARSTPGPGTQTVLVELHGTTAFRGHELPTRRHFSVRVALTAGPHPEPAGLPASARDTVQESLPLPPDPYYFPTSPVHLTGPFVNTRRWRSAAEESTALWIPPGDVFERHPVLSRLTLPALLLCATLRARTLQPDARHTRNVVAPRNISRIDLTTPGNDQTLALAHPQGITTRYDRQRDTYSATAPDAAVLLRITGFQGAPLGSVGPQSATD